jgi:MurNAc alpha-1-phosphate uridylyltransferase
MRHLSAAGVAVSDERDALLDTGGGLRKALPLLGDGPAFTMNTDAVWRGPNPLRALAAHWDPDRMGALLLCVPWSGVRGHAGAGDFDIAADGRLAPGRDTVYSGLQIIRTGGLPAITERAFSMRVLWQDMLARGRLFGLAYGGLWCDAGTPDGIRAAEAMLAEADNV